MLAYFDVFVGVSGDMILGSLVDAGLDLQVLIDTVEALGFSKEIELKACEVHKGSISGTKVDVICEESHHHRGLPEILEIIEKADLPAPVKQQASQVFQKLGEAEAKIHGMSIEEVHFHEVGALDAIVDIVGVAAGLHSMGVTRVISSPIPISHGYVDTAHGLLPIPAPATALLLHDVPIRGIDIEAETVTPTGAALITTLASGYGGMPSMSIQKSGYGAGTWDLALPNMVRIFIGEDDSKDGVFESQTLILMSSNIDDMPGEWFGPLIEKLLAEGALDVWFTPIQMKKNRPAIEINILVSPNIGPEIRLKLFEETTTLGIREQQITRRSLNRSMGRIETQWGSVGVKIAHLPEGIDRISPEFDDCDQLAKEKGVPLWRVYQAAQNGVLEKIEGDAE
jgi:hypothetical protein